MGFTKPKIYYADSNIFKIFTCKFLEGNAANALNKPNNMVISKTLAEKYFGKNAQAVGKTMKTVYDLYRLLGSLKTFLRIPIYGTTC